MYEALEPQGVYLSQSNLEKLCRSNEGKKDPVNAAVNYYYSDPDLFSDNSDEPAPAGKALVGSRVKVAWWSFIVRQTQALLGCFVSFFLREKHPDFFSFH